MTERMATGTSAAASLWFPALDAGSNETFRKAAMPLLDEDTISEASTTVQNNLSTSKAPETRPPPALNLGNKGIREAPPPFFASTRPKMNTVNEKASTSGSPYSSPPRDEGKTQSARNSPSSSALDSPPKVLRRPLAAARNLSTTAMADEPASRERSDASLQVDGPSGVADDSARNSNEADPVWEEEATPAQTAFAKDMLFRRKEVTGSDADSTSSEMGTVIDAGGGGRADRMAEVEAMEAAMKEEESSKQFPFRSRPVPKFDLRPTYSEPLWDDDVDGGGIMETSSMRQPDQDHLTIPMLPTTGLVRKHKKEDEEEKKLGDDNDVSAKNDQGRSNMISMAIRRIGSGLTGGPSQRHNSSMSAPCTPRGSSYGPDYRIGSAATFDDDYLRQSHEEGDDRHPTPSSFLLRSPGSSAHAAASHGSWSQRGMSSPRSQWEKPSNKQERAKKTGITRIPEDKTSVVTTRAGDDRSIANAYQLARSCWSFDAYDTAVDDRSDLPITSMDPRYLIDARDRNVRWLEEGSGGGEGGANIPKSPPRRQGLSASASWDVSSTSQTPSTYRPAVPFRRSGAVPPPRWGSVEGSRTSDVQHALEHSPVRQATSSRIRNDWSPAVANSADAIELKTPQRIEIEREDALDILACLVKRGITLKADDEMSQASSTRGLCNVEQGEDGNVSMSSQHSITDIASAVKELKELCEATDNKDKDEAKSHEARILALDELLRSHVYAMEMKRASQSASFWLQSIGRSAEKVPPEGELSTVSGVGSTVSAQNQSPSENVDLVAAKAMLRSTQIELKEKADYAQRLNEELAICRAEIGRMRSTVNTKPFRSPNRSILDESDDLDQDEDDEEEEDGEKEELKRRFSDASPILSVGDDEINSSFLAGDEGKRDKETTDVQALHKALEEANERIRLMHGQLKNGPKDGENVPETPPTVELPTRSSGKRLSDSPGNKEERTVNVRMLDAENFVTDWDDLAPPLPPPPDHGLRSPIVAAVLEQWTSDGVLHESLLAWMDKVMASTNDLSDVPPLTLSSLDHQVRDGFTMHVLPLLLRRADICVDVKTRVHRRTEYDLTVTVDRSSLPLDLGRHRHLESISARSDFGAADSTTHSAATEIMANGVHTSATAASLIIKQQRKLTPTAENHHDNENDGAYDGGISTRYSYDEMTDGLPVQGHGNHQQAATQPGIMSALGGALGGLLARRRGGGVQAGLSHSTPIEPGLDHQVDHDHFPSTMEEEQHAVLGAGTDDEEQDEQPYHRVVSAPSGRIGVTFVQYRGHAMVSDVAVDSPLSGWIFPSDILIAIDELPVSGMQVRDIIKVLKERSGRQRALRVISSHAMKGFTLHTSMVEDDLK